MNRKKLLGIILALAAAPALALIQPLRINFQGKLIDPSTNNPRTGPVTLIFNLYNVPTAGASLYTETQSMTVTNGVFSVEIGTITALSRELFLGASVYLGVTVQGDTEMLPRQNLVMSAYAFTANQLSDLNEVRLIAGPTYSTFTAAGNLDVPSGISASTGTFSGGITASSGTFLAAGASQYSIAASSGILMSSGTLDINGGGGITNTYGLVTGTLTVVGNNMSVGGSSFTVTGGSATVAYGITASSGQFTAMTGYSLTTSSGIQMNNGYLDINAGGGISNAYGLVSATGSFTTWVTASSATVTGLGPAYGLTVSSGILMTQGTLTVSSTSAGINAYGTGIVLSTIDFTGQALDPTGNAGYMYYNTSSGSLKVFDGSGVWNYVYGQTLSRAFFATTTGGTAIAVAKPTAASILVEPFYLTGPMMVRQLQTVVTTSFVSTGDIGIYTSTGGFVLTGGAGTLTTGTGLKTVTLASTHFLPPGQYYAAVTYNATAGRFAGDTLVAAGLIPGTGSIPLVGTTALPLTITPSSIVNGTIYFLFEMNP